MSLETIDLDIDESAELHFKVNIEGAEGQAKVRLVCESNDLDFVFSGESLGHDNVIKFDVPSMKSKLKEGIYKSKVEVLVDNRYFVPVEFNINFKKTVNVVAESTVIPVNTIQKQKGISVSATPVPVVVKKEVQKEQTLQHKQYTTLKEKFSKKDNQVDEDLLETFRKLLNK